MTKIWITHDGAVHIRARTEPASAVDNSVTLIWRVVGIKYGTMRYQINDAFKWRVNLPINISNIDWDSL